jgi:hypothetical protein
VFALSREVFSPRNHFWVLLEQCAALPFGHPAPDTELDAIVERVGGALGDDGTVPANRGRLALRRAGHEQFVRIGGVTAGLRYPGARFIGNAVDRTVR